MSLPGNAFKQCVQVGVVVHDPDAKVENLVRIFWIKPFRVIDWPPAERANLLKEYHGQPGHYTARIAVADLGMEQLELIEPAQGLSIWQNFLDQHGEGIHHIKFSTSDEIPIFAYLAQNDVKVEMGGDGTQAGNGFFYLDTQDKIGSASS